MNRLKKVNYTGEPIGKINLVSDFLPEPHELVLKEETKKVTLSLTKESLDFFKQAAKTYHTNYQKMIRQLLAQYASHYTEKE
ncbi:MAG: CopG family transcriptional regulator [Pseudomonadota bacterium]